MTWLAQDSKGKAVESLQKTLNKGGASLRIDGDFGAKTKVALLQAQRVLKLSVTGTVQDTDFPQWPPLPAGSVESPDTFMSRFLMPWLTQRDNWKVPTGACNVTSCGTARVWAGAPAVVGGVQIEDAMYDEINGPDARKYMKKNFGWAVDQGIPPQQVLGMLEWIMRRHEFPKAAFTTEASRESVLAALDKAPVILSGKFTKSGHIVCGVGKTKAGDLVVHDPWGDWTSGYAVANGAYRIYPNEKIWNCLDKGGKKVWAMTLG